MSKKNWFEILLQGDCRRLCSPLLGGAPARVGPEGRLCLVPTSCQEVRKEEKLGPLLLQGVQLVRGDRSNPFTGR